MEERLEALRTHIQSLGSVLVCFSGGVDSAFVLAVAQQVLGSRAAGLTTISPSLPLTEREEAKKLAEELGARHILVESQEIDDPRYAANPVNRCYYCKTELYRIARSIAEKEQFAHILNGTNRDDLGDHRPGLDAAKEAGVLSPLVDFGFSKEDVRKGAQLVGLRVWDKPAAACLSSRIPYGTPVTSDRLRQIDQAERGIKALGIRQVRVRHHDKLARVEVAEQELVRAFQERSAIISACKQAGFHFVTLDLEGYRTGSHNEVVKLPVLHG